MTALQGIASSRPQAIYQRCLSKFVAEFDWLRSQAVGQLACFLDLISYEYLIQNVVNMIAATVKGTPAEEVMEHCHPLGRSPFLKSMLTFEKEDNIMDLYRVVLVDMPVAKYFTHSFDSEVKSGEPSKLLQGQFKETDTNVISDHLRKVWLEDFYAYCRQLGGETWTVMKELLEFEADRRAVEIVHNSIAVKSYLNEPAHRAARQDLFCTFGKLYPACTGALPLSAAGGSISQSNFTRVDNDLALAAALEPYPVFREAMRKSQDKTTSLSDALKQTEVQLLKTAFDGQCHFSPFYAYTKLKLLELENIRFIASAISIRGRSSNKNQAIRYVPIF